MSLPFCTDDSDTPTNSSCNAESIGALPCDAFHHFYHYQASAQYLWLSEALKALGRAGEARGAYTKSVFQDHDNEEAIRGRDNPALPVQAPRYAKHPLFDAEFRASVGAPPGTATELHDAGMAALLQGEDAEALRQFDAAIATDPAHSNSRFARGKFHFLREEWEAAQIDLAEAVRLSHLGHDAYHRRAAHEHVVRGRAFLAAGEIDLAINDFTKALDLHRRSSEALLARAGAYRQKGNERLAAADETAAAGK